MGTKLINRRVSQSGFSLIELLVVIAVLAILTIGAVLTAGRGKPTDASDMVRFQAAYERMRAMAIQGRNLHGLTVTSRGLQTARAAEGGWVFAQSEQLLQGRAILVSGASSGGRDQPDIVFLPNGRSTAFTISFSGGNRCEGDGWAGVTCN